MNLLIAGNIKFTKEELLAIRNYGYDITINEKENASYIPNAQEYDLVICNFLFVNHDIKLFKKLKAVQLLSAGLDRIPMNYARKHNIDVRNAKGVYSIPIAEFVVMTTLEIYKNSFMFYENQKKHRWEKIRDLDELSSKTICIFGTGNVGTEIAKHFTVFTDNIIGVDIKPLDNNFFDKIYGVDGVEEALKRSDVIILTLPLTDKTFHMFDEDLFQHFKDDAVLINVARGGLIDEIALKRQLDSGKFKSVVLDVFDKEPLDENYWGWSADRVRIIPHNSFVSKNNEYRLKKQIMENLKDWASRFDY